MNLSSTTTSSTTTTSSRDGSSSVYTGSLLHRVLKALDSHVSPPLSSAPPEVLLALLVAPFLVTRLQTAAAAVNTTVGLGVTLQQHGRESQPQEQRQQEAYECVRVTVADTTQQQEEEEVVVGPC
jgi:hypothetical protein